jgi:predicted ester cyclase
MGIPPTGKPVTISALIVSRFAGGKWAEDWVNIDALGMLQQIGAIPAPGAA